MEKYSEYTPKTKNEIIKLVVCHCGTDPKITDYTDYGEKGPWQAKCPTCFRNVTAKTELEVCKKWNIKYDWFVHELNSLFSEEEYTKMVEDCGGYIRPSSYWEKTQDKPCKHCERRERIKESIMKEIEKETNDKQSRNKKF